MRMYLAGPISGKSFDEVIGMINTKVVALEAKIPELTVRHPMIGKGELRNETHFKKRDMANDNPVITDHAIYERDRWMVQTSDIILADFTNATKASIGSCFELAWAAQAGKLVIVIMDKGNPHNHAFVKEAADIVFESFAQAVSYLEKLIHTKV